MRYESNPKHSEPWQQGARGTLCPKEIDQATARRLLMESELDGSKRYAVHEGRAYCAQQHGEDVWHGYPVGWRKVPEGVWRKWLKEERVSRGDRRKYWD